MKWKVNGKYLDNVSEGMFLYFDVVVDGRFGLVGKGDALQNVCSGGVVEVDSVVVVASFHSVLRMFVVGGFFCFCGDRCVSWCKCFVCCCSFLQELSLLQW